jgi:hypothetical protein
MSVILSPLAGAGWQFFDNNGVPLAGGLLYTYAAGTTTQLATYTSISGNVANSNPIVLDASGRVSNEIWLTTGFGYKFVLQTSNATQIASYDNIPSNGSPFVNNDASSISYEQGTSTNAGNFITGVSYQITSVGTTNFIAIGASSNTVGTVFVATGAGSGTGTAQVSRTIQNKFQESISVKDFGALGNGTADDTVAIQTAINYARTNLLTLNFPSGTYKTTSALNWSQWGGISVKGTDPGGAEVSGSSVPVQIIATGVTGVAHDFCGSAYGKISGLAFGISGGAVTANVLLARITSGTVTYGSDLVFENCNFKSGSVTGVLAHVAEVLTFRDCRFYGGGVPGCVITNRGGSSPWSITPPFGETFVAGTTLTVFRFFGGEFVGNNSQLLVFDWSGSNSGGDVGIFGTYFATSGANCSAIGFYGDWENGVIEGVRCEETSISGSNHGLVYLNSNSPGTSIRNWKIHGRAVGASGYVVFGTGAVVAAQIISECSINLTGSLTDVDYFSVNPLYLNVTGNVNTFTSRCNGIGTLYVTGAFSIDDGFGGWIVSYQPLFATGTATYQPSGVDGLFIASYAGSKILFFTTGVGGTQLIYQVALWNDTNGGTGSLSLSGTVITATYQGTGDNLVIRRLS